MKNLGISISHKQHKELRDKLRKKKCCWIRLKITHQPTPIEIIIDDMFMKSFGVKFDDFDIEKTPLQKTHPKL